MAPARTKAVGYARQREARQADTRAGLDAQRDVIAVECFSRGWKIQRVYEDVEVIGARTNRAGLATALAALDRGEANVLVVASLDRVARSTSDVGDIVQRADANGWAVVVVGGGLDTTTSQGATTAKLLLGLGERNRGGRRANLPGEVVDRIVAMRNAGNSWPVIANTLNTDRIPTAQGGAQWYPSTVRTVFFNANRAPEEV